MKELAVKSEKIDYFENVADFMENLLEVYRIPYKDLNVTPVSVVAPYHVMIELVNLLIKTTSLNLYSCAAFEDAENLGGDYFDNYILDIDSKGNLWIERALRGHTYLFLDDIDTICFVWHNARGVIQKNYEKDLILFNVGQRNQKRR